MQEEKNNLLEGIEKNGTELEDPDRGNFAKVGFYAPSRTCSIWYFWLFCISCAVASILSLYLVYGVLFAPKTLPLGVDSTGFVPPEIGEPLRWIMFDESNPYYIKEDVFDHVETTKAFVVYLKATHNSTFLRAEGHHTTYVDPDGNVVELPPHIRPSGHEFYAIRAIHEMHCINVLVEAYGFEVHNQASQWAPGHVAHCLNTLRDAIMCSANAMPVSYLAPGGHLTDRQQMRCRDYSALRDWANEPSRGVRFRNVAPPGSEKDKIEEIISFAGAGP
ncbi:hypothetical protein HBH56_205480 [Parastagonospora nodorum]|uniref:Uncharacterized protein n=1 Tax=Phaeosphaeria nodorum (strain SN15 / ATCC MYA-4574 / FGSC 10173) TaxID=321614 RepID=A0A7U2F146_PHANO|nr:hypothetical protein HBH56_205480 [Parastagonospora nodorum]QRC94775.1 hypothetical protein JI435_431220 [Parastagonospora nodorum SN15]KAH3923738.1 hypothetical protein HBH54_204350 [Parastagonospora nodorum]KAH3962343.1 hypothetical protein HBH51_175640 [Parastagonospora nodorum]KAH3967238.1 hypothetical protein HBH52_192070 [Parastagonospora nodorum]